MRVLPGATKSNQVLAWSPDGRFVAAAGSGDGVTVWDVNAGTPGRRVLNSGHGGRLMQFCPRTGRLYVAFQSGGFWHWEPDTDTEISHAWTGEYIQFYGLTVSADGRTIVANCYRKNSRKIIGFTVDDGGMREAWAHKKPDWRNEQSFVFRPDTDELFGLISGSVLRFEWVRAQTNEPVGFFEHPSDGPYFAVKRWVLSPDGERVVWITDNGLFLRRLNDDATLTLPAAGELRRGVAFHPDGRTLAYTTGTTVRLLDADTLAEVRALDWGTGKARAVAFSPDGLRAAVSAEGGKGYVTVFDLE